MKNVDADPKAELVRDYLERLRAAATGLPPDRREELLAEVREHIGAALIGRPAGRPRRCRSATSWTGWAPEEIVRAELEDLDAARRRPGRRGSRGHRPAVGSAGGRRAGDAGGRRHRAARLRSAARPAARLAVATAGRTPQKLVASALALLPVILILPVALISAGAS